MCDVAYLDHNLVWSENVLEISELSLRDRSFELHVVYARVFFSVFLNLQASHGNLNVGQTVKDIAQ